VRLSSLLTGLRRSPFVLSEYDRNILKLKTAIGILDVARLLPCSQRNKRRAFLLTVGQRSLRDQWEMASTKDFKVVMQEDKIAVTHTTGHRYEFSIEDNELTHVLVTPNHAASEHVSKFEEEARKLALERLGGKDEG
jgi:hypothetical protein